MWRPVGEVPAVLRVHPTAEDLLRTKFASEPARSSNSVMRWPPCSALIRFSGPGAAVPRPGFPPPPARCST